MEEGVKHIHGYGTADGAYALIEVDDPKAFDQYQMFHINNYSHFCRIRFEPLTDLGAVIGAIEGEIELTWTAPGDAATGLPAAFYIVKYSPAIQEALGLVMQ